MRIRNTGTPKSAAPTRTQPARKSATKTPPNLPDSAAGSSTPKPAETKRCSAVKAKQVKSNEPTPTQNTGSDTKPAQTRDAVEEVKGSADAYQGTTPGSATESATPKPTETKPGSATKAKQVKNNETTPTQNTVSNSKTEQPSVEEVKASANTSPVTPITKAVSGTKSVAKKTAGKGKTPASAKSASTRTPKSREVVKANVEESLKKEEEVNAKDVESKNTKKQESAVKNVGESAKMEQYAKEVEETAVEKVEESSKKEQISMEVEEPVIDNVGESSNEEQTMMEVEAPLATIVDSLRQEEPVVAEVAKSSESEKSCSAQEGKKTEENTAKIVDIRDEPKIEPVSVAQNIEEELQGEDAQPENEYGGDEGMDMYSDRVDLEDHGDEELAEVDVEEPAEEAEAMEEENKELTAIAKEHKIKKEHEIFVGGLERDATEEDLRNVFEKIGEVVEVRLHRNPSSIKNKGYAFVKFANKEHAKRALSEMKNPLINGKRCGTAPSEDNDTLFLGNICNTWTKEAIKQKLKDYGVEGVENITLVPDVQHEGLSRGFAFLEFSCHADAMLAYKRLQKPDVIFGHLERTAKVAFAEPLREPDPEVMAQVKSVFVDGLPSHWDEDHVREQFKGYGEILRIVLARNMSTAKRNDFGFVDFSTHEAAVACIEGISNTELADGNSKTKVRARLSNPLPKTQAVKGGMCGGFRIGHGGARSISKFGREFGRGGQYFNRSNFQYGRGFYQRGHGQSGRMGFPNQYDFDNTYAEFHGRHVMGRGGRRGSLRGGHGGGTVTTPSRPNLNRPWHGAADRGRGHHVPFRRQPFIPEEGFDRPFVGRHFDDPYLYDDNAPGLKRPFYMRDDDPDYMGPSRLRPRLDYTDPRVSFRGSRYRDTFGAGSGTYSDDYYGSDHGGGAYLSYYGVDHPYGGGYYY